MLTLQQSKLNKHYIIMQTEDLKYESPLIEFIEVEVEKGFATSGESYKSEPLGW